MRAVIWHRKNPNYFVVIPELPTAQQTIEDIAGQPWTIDTLIEKEKQREAEGTKARSLRQLIEDLEDEVLANAGVDVFEEVFKLIFTKLYDELACHRKWKGQKFLRFRNQNTAAQLKVAIQNLFDEAKQKWPGVFPPDDKIKLTADHLQVCIGSLEEWKLFNSNLDVVDDAFEYLVNKSSKGEKGQYFTPRWVIDMCVKMLNPQEQETLVDTACGSAGFTVHSIFHVWKDILKDEGLPVSHLFTMDEKPARCIEHAREKVFGIDFDEKSVRVARCLNLIAGDGETNILHLNTLDWKKWDETIKQEDWTDTYGPGWSKLKKFRAKNGDNRAFQFDVLMANPPFAGDLKQPDMVSLYDLGHKANGKPEDKVGRDLLFIERNLDFIRPGGRMAVVLPQGRFNNSSDQRVREFIAERCRILAVVGLHPSTFKPHTGTKTSVIFVQKWNDDPKAGPLCKKVDDYNIFFATQRQESKDTSGDKILVTKRLVKFFAHSDDARMTILPEDEFEKEYGSIKRATKYRIDFPDGRHQVINGEKLEQEFGSVSELTGKRKATVVNLEQPWMFEEYVRDTHGHYVVQHDFFSVDLRGGTRTSEGIAEAFAEFGKREKLSFFA